LPVVAGPILFLLAVERGEAFASGAASASLSAVFASVAFSLSYAHAAQRLSWLPSLFWALFAWGIAAFALSLLPSSVGISLVVALATLIAGPRLFPSTQAGPAKHVVGFAELVSRLLAGAVLTVAVTVAAGRLGHGWSGLRAVLTVAVTVAAGRLGHGWSGLLAVFPVLGIVLAVFSHRTQGSAFATALLRAMVTGLYSFATFCFAVSVALPYTGVASAFAVAVVLAITVQVAMRGEITAARS
jgi:hypothetical protein